MEASKIRNPLVAFLLSLLTPGLGQIYNAQLIKGISLFFVGLLAAYLAHLTGAILTFSGAIVYLGGGVLFYVYVIVDAVVVARRRKFSHPTSYHRWYFYAALFIGMFVISYFVEDKIAIEAYRITTASMLPTLEIDDLVIADVEAYVNKVPDYGDIVAFKTTTGHGVWTHRIVGLPGDTVEIKENMLYINGLMLPERKVRSYILETAPIIEFEETLPNQRKIHILHDETYFESNKTFAPNVVPPLYYFLLGDNRDNAEDSRHIGAVHRDSIVGKLVYTYCGASSGRMGLDLRAR